MVKETAKIISIIEIDTDWSFNNNEKKAKSGKTLEFSETAIKPQNPIKKR